MTECDEKALSVFAGRALSTLPTVHNSFTLAENCILKSVPGDFVECGVFAGTQVAAMAYACQKHCEHRKVHLFDSFEGIPESGAHDDETITALLGVGKDRLRSTGVSVCTIAQVERHMDEWGIEPDRLEYHSGWFQNTIPRTEIRNIALLRLDGDLYSSTKVCLEYLYSKVSRGGYVVIDDYALTGCRKAVSEYLRAHDIWPDIHEVEGGLGPVWWRVY